MKSVPDFQARLGLTLSASLLAMAACAANADDSLLTYTFGNGATVTTYGQINEAWLKLRRQPVFNDDNHFLCTAAVAMRQVLVDHARARLTAKRGDDLTDPLLRSYLQYRGG